MHDIKTCPTCSSRRIRRVREDVSGEWMGRRFVARDIEFYECPVCGERIYDPDAMRKIQRSYSTRKNVPRRKAS
jgi:YgiT-type zinc finger domain-containing protein